MSGKFSELTGLHAAMNCKTTDFKSGCYSNHWPRGFWFRIVTLNSWQQDIADMTVYGWMKPSFVNNFFRIAIAASVVLFGPMLMGCSLPSPPSIPPPDPPPVDPTLKQVENIVFYSADPSLGLPGIYTRIESTGEVRALLTANDSILVTTSSGFEWKAVRSSDPLLTPIHNRTGTKIAFIWKYAFDANGLVVMNVDGSDPRLLPVGGAIAPQWSPSGGEIMFLSQGPIGSVVSVQICDSTGMTCTTFLSFGDNINTSLDGSKLYFYTPAQGDYQWGASDNEIYCLASVNVSPDTVIGYNQWNEVICLDRETRNVKKRVTNNAYDENNFRVSPDGKYVLFLSGLYKGTSAFWRASTNDQSVRVYGIELYVDVYWAWAPDSHGVIAQIAALGTTDFHLYEVTFSNTIAATRKTDFLARDPSWYIPQ